jgi:hypothetical protein
MERLLLVIIVMSLTALVTAISLSGAAALGVVLRFDRDRGGCS